MWQRRSFDESRHDTMNCRTPGYCNSQHQHLPHVPPAGGTVAGAATATSQRQPPPVPARRSPARPGSVKAAPKDDPPAFLSPLWGNAGELFNPAGRMTDWSRAGYAGGAADIPEYQQLSQFNVRRFGALANGSGARGGFTHV